MILQSDFNEKQRTTTTTLFDHKSVGPTINTEKYGLLLAVDQTMNQNWMSATLFQQNEEKIKPLTPEIIKLYNIQVSWKNFCLNILISDLRGHFILLSDAKHGKTRRCFSIFYENCHSASFLFMSWSMPIFRVRNQVLIDTSCSIVQHPIIG